MKRLLLAAFLFTSTIGSASAAKVSFLGHFSISAESSACGGYVGSRGLAQFIPQLAGTDNGSGSTLAFHQDIWAQAFRVNTGLFTSTFKNVDSMYIGRYFGPQLTSQLKITTQIPATIKATTTFIDMVGQITNYDGNLGCTITFVASFTPKY